MRRYIGLSLLLCLVAAPVVAAAPDHPVVVAQGASGALELVGHSPLNNRGMNAALAIKGDYAYVGSRTDAKANNANGAGVLVVDISKPDAPAVVSVEAGCARPRRAGLAELARQFADLLIADEEVEKNPEKYFDQIVEIDLSTLEPQVVGPKDADSVLIIRYAHRARIFYSCHT